MQAGGQQFDSAYLHHMRKWLSGRASPCQGEGREFESRLPLHQKADSTESAFFIFFESVKILNDVSKAVIDYNAIENKL